MVALCLDMTGSFSVESPTDCNSMGLDSRTFRTVNIDNRNSWTTRFVETEPYGRKRAEAAGLQRLLTDAGVADTDIDGYIGRRTRVSIASFLKANNLPNTTKDASLIDILEEVARNRSHQLGLTICNRADAPIWTAIARRRGEGWESRGWWAIQASSCIRTIDDNLIATPHYIFAEMETPRGVRSLKNAQEIFCIARSRFAIVGRDNCEARAYREADFIRTDAPVDGRMIVEFFDRDFLQADVDG